MSTIDDMRKVKEASPKKFKYFTPGEGIAAVKNYKKSPSGRYVVEAFFIATKGEEANPEGSEASISFNIAWDSHLSDLQDFLECISRDPMPKGATEYAKTAASLINDEQPLRGRVFGYKTVYATKKDGSIKTFVTKDGETVKATDTTFTRLEQDDAAVAKVRANLE